MIKVYYWKAGDQILAMIGNQIIDILSEDFYGGLAFTTRYTPSQVAKMKTLVYLGVL